MTRGRPAAKGCSWRAIALAGGLAWLAPGAAHAQVAAAPTDETALLREAAALETAGDLAGAERLLRSVLSATPTSLSALISLERILAMQGNTQALIPALDRLLAKDADSPIGHQMRVRAFSALDRVDELERAAEAWIKASPTIETPYREIARVWRERNELTRAVDVLERGRARIKRADALALELGDVYAQAADYSRAVREWNRAIGRDGHGFLLVQRRLTGLPDGGASAIPELVEALTRPPTSVARQRAATQIAIEAGLAPQAESIARATASALEEPARRSFLVEVARRADGAGLSAVAYWAYRELIAAGGPAGQMLALRTRAAELALAVGDTASAAAQYAQLEQAYAAGSPQRRQAVAVRIQLLARDGELDRAASEYASFRREFDDATETDGVAASLANALLDRGEESAAEDVLVGVHGPRSGLARARVLMRRGEVERARNELLGSAPSLHGAEATETIALASLLGRLSAEGGELVGRAMALAAEGDREEGVKLLLEGSGAIAGNERAAILEFAATLADRARLEERAEQIRREIVSEYPRSREAPSALLALARTVAQRPGSHDEARLLLERLILEHPRSALVPQARRELDRLLGRVPPGGGG